MNAIKNGDFSESLQKITMAIDEVQAGYDVATARVERLLETAFEDAKRAKAAFRTLTRQRDPEEVIRILANNDTGRRTLHFGFTRGSLFARGERHLARQALDELPEAIRDRQSLALRLSDLMKARHAATERLDQERLREQAPDQLGRSQSRTRQ